MTYNAALALTASEKRKSHITASYPAKEMSKTILLECAMLL